MSNPCSQCIVKPMCREPCYMLITYLKENLSGMYSYWPDTVAKDFLNGECIFIYLGNTILKVVYPDE